jgi:LacI family transcriptional regulator
MSTPTLKSIAEATGYSITTVSRALGGFSDVSERTRSIIMEEARRQNYQPNIHARRLKGQRSQTIGLVVPSAAPHFYDPFFTTLIAGIGNRAALDAFDLLLSTHLPQVEDELAAYRRVINGHNVDGMVVVRVRQDDARITFLRELEIPFVVFGRSPHHASRDYVHIDTDGEKAQYQLTEHLIAQGHERICYVAPPDYLTFAHYRLAGFRRAMTAHHLPLPDAWVIYGDALTEAGGRRAAERVLALPQPPTAIMAGNDRMATGIMALLQERDVRIGTEIAVAGFDDIHSAAHLYPGLTTMRQPLYDIGERLADLLLRTIAGDPLESHAVILDAELVVRGSTLRELSTSDSIA